jgi:osmotically-inducible protein OsmY
MTMANRYDRARRGRDTDEWDRNQEWDRSYDRFRANRSRNPGYEEDPYRDFNRGIGLSRDQGYSRGQGYNRGQGYDRDWDQGYRRGSYNRGGLSRYGDQWANDADRDRGWDTGTDVDSDWDTGTTWTYSETWWIVPGPFAGIGPRGYQRSDERILEDVSERLTQNGQIDASDISVGVSEGVVILIGTVNSRQGKRLAEDLAESVSGVEDVDNQLRVQRAEQGRGRTISSGQHCEVREGMEVVGSNGEHIGAVKRVNENSFIVDRPVGQDIAAPFSACASTEAGRVKLNIPASQVENQNWQIPEQVDIASRGEETRSS